LTGLSGVTVVDVDAPELVAVALARFGDTPIKVRTPSGGMHLYYRANGEGRRIRLDDRAVDILGAGSMVVVPPSIRPSGSHAGKAYTFEAGSWADLKRLPVLKPGSLYDGRTQYEGNRDNSLFSFLLRQAYACDTPDDLTDVARDFNDTVCQPPLPDGQVLKIARSAWKYQEEGRNWAREPARAVFTKEDIDHLTANPDAFAFEARLRVAHGTKHKTFALAATSMARDNVMPGWERKRYMRLTKWLVRQGRLEQVHKGGKGRGDPSLYRFPKRVPEMDPI
jgi:hypothetical protein